MCQQSLKHSRNDLNIQRKNISISKTNARNLPVKLFAFSDQHVVNPLKDDEDEKRAQSPVVVVTFREGKHQDPNHSVPNEKKSRQKSSQKQRKQPCHVRVDLLPFSPVHRQ